MLLHVQMELLQILQPIFAKHVMELVRLAMEHQIQIVCLVIHRNSFSHHQKNVLIPATLINMQILQPHQHVKIAIQHVQHALELLLLIA